MAISKVTYDGQTLIDLTSDTAVESDVASGKYFHKADGTRVQGTASHSVNLQNKTVSLGSAAPSAVSADTGYDGLGTVSFNTTNIDGTKIRTGSSVCGVAGSYAGIIPAGNKDIDTTSQVGVSAYATARISATERAKIISGNIKSGVTILGVTGTYTGTTPVFGRSIDVTIMPVDGTEETSLTILARTPGDPGSEQNLQFSSITPEQVFDPDDPQYFDYQATIDLVPGVGDGFFLTVEDWSIGSITAGAQYFLSRTVGTQKIYYIFINDNNLQNLGIDLN